MLALVLYRFFAFVKALKVLDTYSANIQRQGSGRIQNKAAYLMSLIQSYKLGPNSGSPGSAQRLIERLSPPVRRAVEGVFDPVVDRIVLEDRALMELLAKVPEEQVRPTVHVAQNCVSSYLVWFESVRKKEAVGVADDVTLWEFFFWFLFVRMNRQTE